MSVQEDIEGQINDDLAYECFTRAVKRAGFKDINEYLVSEATEKRQAVYREYERLINRIISYHTKPIRIPEGLCQSNNLNHLFTVM